MQRVTLSVAKLASIAITTTDSGPAVAPFKISAKPGFNVATVTMKFTPTGMGLMPSEGLVPHDGLVPDGPVYYRCIRVIPSESRIAAPWYPISIRRGLVCGLDRCGPNARSLQTEGPLTIVDDVTYTELGETGDGNFPEWVHFLTDEGWY
jgi:hypothetical protein